MLKSSDDIMLFNTVCLTQQCLRIPHKKWPNVSKDVLCKMANNKTIQNDNHATFSLQIYDSL